MNEQGSNIPEVVESGVPFDPTFLNLEFFFNQILSLFRGVYEWILYYSSGTFFIQYIKVALSALSVIFITVILYSLVRIFEVRKKENSQFHFAEPIASNGGEKRERWEVVQNYLHADSPTDWRLAIIEADSILDDMVKKMGYDGDTLGERLKAVEVSDFNSIQSAWEAHKVRNQIAHEGSGFALTHREARRVIALYEDVFREFEYI